MPTNIVDKSLLPSSIRWSIPEKILQLCSIIKGSAPVRQGLIKWSQLPSLLSTWEDLDYLHQQFPRTAVWGHPGAQGRGDVTPDAQPAVPDGQQEASALGSAGGRLERANTKSVKVFGPDWVNE
jgi:hypothetical protein